MKQLTTKSIDGIDKRMEESGEDPIRHRILQSARNFKTSWIDLGQSLYSAWKDKLYKEWGYMTFDAYTAKEIGIKKQTALKLLKSYYFLEREEPAVLEKNRSDESPAATVPGFESVNLLRLAKDAKKIDGSDYASLRREVFEGGKDAGDMRKSITGMMKEREELEPEEARENKRIATIKRSIGALKALKRELDSSKMLPASIIKDLAGLISKIESEIG